MLLLTLRSVGMFKTNHLRNKWLQSVCSTASCCMSTENVTQTTQNPFKDSKFLSKSLDYFNKSIVRIKYEGDKLFRETDIKQCLQGPKPALAVGIAGLLPFVTPTLSILSHLEFNPATAHIQILYGATVLSFLGGVRWGALLSKEMTWENVGLSVMPPLLAWSSLLTSYPTVSLITVSGGLIASLYLDQNIKCYPAWFKALRLLLTTGAVGALMLTFILRCALPLGS